MRRLALQQAGDYDAQQYQNTQNMRDASTTPGRTAALNSTLGLTNTNQAFTEQEVKQLWKDGTYQGIMNGGVTALQELKNNKILEIQESFKGYAKDGIINVDDVKKSTSAINGLLGLEGEAALSAETIANN